LSIPRQYFKLGSVNMERMNHSTHFIRFIINLPHFSNPLFLCEVNSLWIKFLSIYRDFIHHPKKFDFFRHRQILLFFRNRKLVHFFGNFFFFSSCSDTSNGNRIDPSSSINARSSKVSKLEKSTTISALSDGVNVISSSVTGSFKKPPSVAT